MLHITTACQMPPCRFFTRYALSMGITPAHGMLNTTTPSPPGAQSMGHACDTACQPRQCLCSSGTPSRWVTPAKRHVIYDSAPLSRYNAAKRAYTLSRGYICGTPGTQHVNHYRAFLTQVHPVNGSHLYRARRRRLRRRKITDEILRTIRFLEGYSRVVDTRGGEEVLFWRPCSRLTRVVAWVIISFVRLI